MDDTQREIKLAEILGLALDLPQAKQRAFVQQSTDDPELAAEILGLLQEADESFLEKPAIAVFADNGEATFVEGPLLPVSEAPTVENRPIASKVGPYRIEECLGSGGMGVIYRGFDERLQRPVALKQIRRRVETPETQRRFRREARAIAKVDHEAIVRVHDWLQEDDGDWLVMELIDGRHLGQILETHGPQDPRQVISWASEIASALSAAHEAGILHRDLKVENVMVTKSGGLKLLDFGLAKPLDQNSSFAGSLDEPLTTEGNILGTVSAMSPEQAMGEDLDERSDLFSLGSLIYRLLAGKSPFRGDFPMATMQSVVYENPEPLSTFRADLPTSLVRLIDKLLAKDRKDRPRNARQVVAQLREIALQRESGQAETDTAQKSTRRPVTVLAAGLSLDAAAGDPEALLDIVPKLHEIVLSVIERWGGRLEGRMGDSWIACFGVPQAQEDDARRAVHAGLDLFKEAASAGDDERQDPLSQASLPPLRVGIHSGTAIITTVGERQELALGPTFDAAVAAQGQREPGVFISGGTEARAGRFFRIEGVQSLGTTDQTIFRVEGPDDFTELQSGIMQPLFGRTRELLVLTESFQVAREGMGRVVLLTGEPGIGKSSLLSRLRIQLRNAGSERAAAWIELHGSMVRRSSPFQPVVLQLRKMLDVQPSDSSDRQLDALENLLEKLDLPADEMVPQLAVLLAIQTGDRYTQSDLDPRLRRRRIQEALATLWMEMADQRPLVMVVEDLQWLDPSTIEVLTLLIEQVPTVPMMLVLTSRLDYESPFKARGHIAEVRLERLAGQAVAEQVAAISGVPLPTELVERIAAKADGVPLYIEELTRVVLESGQLIERDGRYELQGPLDRLIIPSSLQESLAARLDRLGQAREVAQLASVIGREFSKDLLLKIDDGDETILDQGLEKLVSADLAYRKGFGRRARYLFRHSLIQDAAYTSLLRRRRRLLHRRVADELAKSNRVAVPPELLAHHLSEAGDWAEAIGHWQAAGTAAILASAHNEAEAHARKALGAIAHLKDAEARDRAELGLLTLLGRAVAGLRGYSSEEVLEAYDRAAKLCENIADDLLVTQVNWGLWAFYIVRSDISRALDHARRLLNLADRSGATSDWLVAHSSMAVAHYFGGDLTAARRHAESAIEYEAANPERDRTTASPQDLGVNALMSLALVDWHHGDSANALDWSTRALELAEQFRHPYSQVFAGSWSARLQQSRRDAGETRRLAEEVVRISEQHGFFWATQGWFFRGCAIAQAARNEGLQNGDNVAIPDEAVEWMQRGLKAYRATGARLSVSYMQAQMAEVHLWRKDLEKARQSLAEAEAAAAPGREQFWRPELHRLAAEIRIAEDSESDRGSIEKDFRRAIELAEFAGDRALALRACLGLASFWQLQGFAVQAAELIQRTIEPWGQEALDDDVCRARELLAVASSEP